MFVTPRRWRKKARWVDEQRAEKQWNDVRAYDASDLEQWLEQSIPGQLWFAEATGQPTNGLVSLVRCWYRWRAGCRPPLEPCLFDEAISRSKTTVERWHQGGHGTTLSIAADSKGEALAFLYALFLDMHGPLGPARENVVVFEQPGLLARLLRPSSDLIPVVTSQDLELEVAEHLEYCKPTVLRSRAGSRSQHDIVLEPLHYGAFRSALESMGCGTDIIERYCRESGRSLTVLRRRLSTLPDVQTPDWASCPRLTRLMAPLALAGSWDRSSEFDTLFLSILVGDRSRAAIEEHFGDLLRGSDPPVWRIGSHRGVVSRIDALFTVGPALTADLLGRYLEVAASVLSEDDPALDLPEEEQWLADLHGKNRECSQALRLGIAETLVLLSVFGDELCGDRLGIDLPDQVDGLVRRLPDPFTARTLESQSEYLPTYAEAAPGTLLDLIEGDLKREDASEVLRILRPVESDTADCPREGLLEALETLAWSGKTLARTIDVLAKLAIHPINDLWAKTPETCLEAIFRSWLPQTSVGIEGRLQVFERLAQAAPDVAWRLCCNQLKPGARAGEFSAKARWRKDSDGFGHGVGREDDECFQLRCCEYLLTRNHYSRQELADLIWLLRSLPDARSSDVWELIDQWRRNADEQDRAWLRDRVRYEWLRHRPAQFRTHPQERENIQRALSAYTLLEPSDPVLKHRWLSCDLQWFDDHDVPLEAILGCDQPAASAVGTAIAETHSHTGINGILRLASSVDGQGLIARRVASLGLGVSELSDLVRSTVEGEFRGTCDGLARVLLADLDDALRAALYSKLNGCLSIGALGYALRLAPFRRDTWRTVETLGDDCVREYWLQADPRGAKREPAECDEAVEQLMGTGRTLDALWLAARCLETIGPKRLYRVLAAVTDNASGDRERPSLNASVVEDIGRAIARVRESHLITGQRMAVLELRLFDALEDCGSYTPALDKALAQDARLHAELVECASRIEKAEEDRDTGEEGELLSRINSRTAWLVLKKKRFVPGASEHDPVSSEWILAWVRRARELCEARGNRKEGDYWIGRLLSAAGTGDDGVWPCEAARDALNVISNDAVNAGFQCGVYGSGGFRATGVRGAEEKQQAELHANWSEALQDSHPKVSSLLGRVAEEYRHMSKALSRDGILREQLLNST